MKFWDAPSSSLPYTIDEVTSAFWDRYPNSYAKHIMSEDVLDRHVTENTIVTKKLIVKEGNSIIKRVPRWLSKMTTIRVVPVIEESVYDRTTKRLTTYTRNVAHNELFSMHERCVYKPTDHQEGHHVKFLTDVLRTAFIHFDYGRMSSICDKVFLMGFKNSIVKTTKGLTEKLEERFGVRQLHNAKMQQIKEKIIKSSSNIVTHVKCEEE